MAKDAKEEIYNEYNTMHELRIQCMNEKKFCW